MRIAFLADFPVHCLPNWEGSADTGYYPTWLPVFAEALGQVDHGHEVHWVCCSKQVSGPRVVRAWNQQFHLLPRGKLSVEILTRFRGERKRVAACLRKLQPDQVHAWGTEQGYAMAALDSGLRAVLLVQGLLSVLCRRERQPWLMRWQAECEQRTLQSFSTITLESAWAEARVRESGSQASLHRVVYGIGPEWFEVVRTPAEHAMVTFVGTLSRSKGVDVLLRAFEDSRLATVKLVLLGEGPCRRPSSGQFIFLGQVPPAKARECLAKSWALIHPTIADVCPNSVKEARVVGLPVVTTSEGGQAEWVEDGKSGVIHAVGDVEALIQGILKVTTSAELSLTMGSSGRDDCRARARAVHGVEQWTAVVKHVADSAVSEFHEFEV